MQQALPRGIIIGAGIAGLTAALALRQRGIEAVVYEAAPAIRPLGAGIWMAPNAMQVFDRLGLAGRIEAAGVPLHHIEITDGQLRPLLRPDQQRVQALFGYGTTAIGRAVLQALLLAAVGPAGVRLGQTCTGLRQDAAGATVAFADGHTARADFVVGADGIHSPLRALLLPGAAEPRAVGGYLVWRGMARLALPPRLQAGIREAWAGGLRFGFSEVGEGVVDWFAAVPGRFGSGRESLLARLEAAFAGFADPVPAILAATPEPAVIGTQVLELPWLPAWHRGRVGLIGDAAHAGTPYLGQGGCQAVEDAYALALCLARHPPDPAAAFRALYRLRRGPARRVWQRARLLGRVGYWQGAAAGLRDAAIRALPRWVTERQFDQVYRLRY